MSSLSGLIGKRCCVIFNLQLRDWPFHGYPAFVYVVGVDSSLIGLSSHEKGGHIKWVSTAIITEISESA